VIPLYQAPLAQCTKVGEPRLAMRGYLPGSTPARRSNKCPLARKAMARGNAAQRRRRREALPRAIDFRKISFGASGLRTIGASSSNQNVAPK